MTIDAGRRAEALELLRGGLSAHKAAGRFGFAPSTVWRWAKVAGMVFEPGTGGIVGVAVRRWPQPGPAEDWLDANGRLTAAGRVLIGIRLREKRSYAQIADEIGVHRSTIKREVDNASADGRYRAAAAHRRHREQARRPKPVKLVPGSPVWQAVVWGLNHRFSPEQISGWLRLAYPGREDRQVSHETIYQALYVQGAGSLRQELSVVKALRSGRTSRKPRSKLPPRSNRSWIGDAVIANRPAEVADRAVPGHWEGDLIIGGSGNLASALITLVERTSRFTLIERLDVHDADTVAERLTLMAQRIPDALLRSLTWDQGVEMAQHARFSVATGCPVFFCDPHSPWQRPTNENTNGLIRDFFPKGTNFSDITDAETAEAEHLLNIRPRKVLTFATPGERLAQLLTVASAA